MSFLGRVKGLTHPSPAAGWTDPPAETSGGEPAERVGRGTCRNEGKGEEQAVKHLSWRELQALPTEIEGTRQFHIN